MILYSVFYLSCLNPLSSVKSPIISRIRHAYRQSKHVKLKLTQDPPAGHRLASRRCDGVPLADDPSHDGEAGKSISSPWLKDVAHDSV